MAQKSSTSLFWESDVDENIGGVFVEKRYEALEKESIKDYDVEP